MFKIVKKEWVEAIKYIKNKKEWNYTDVKLIKNHKKMIDSDFKASYWDDDNLCCLNEIKDLDILIAILMDEYEVQKTDEETLIDIHRQYLNNCNNEYNKGVLQGLEYAMDKLKFKY